MPALFALLLCAPNDSLERAFELYQDAQFAASLQMLDRMDARKPVQTERVRIKFYVALNFHSIGNADRASKSFTELLELDPDFVLPTLTPPGVRQTFNDIKARFRVVPVLSHTQPLQIESSAGVELHVSIAKMRPGYNASAYYRLPGASRFTRLDLVKRGERDYAARLPAALLVRDRSYTLHYYFSVSDGQRELASQRSAQDPYSVPVATAVALETPVARKWWFWTTLVGGALVAAGAATAAVLLTRSATSGDATVTVSR